MELENDLIGRTLRLGDSGPAVKALQMLLASIDADGVFGAGTELALLAFQRANGLTPDGIAGPLTVAALTKPVPPGDSDLDAVARLVGFAGRGKYVLGAGGEKPTSPTPFGWRGAQNGADCIGAVMWAEGCPRHHDAFPEYEGDINTDSAIMDATGLMGGKGLRKFFTPVEPGGVKSGTIVIYPSVWARDVWPGHEAEHGHKPGDMVRMGHVGLVVGWDGIGPDPSRPEKGWDGVTSHLVTVECCASWPAVRLGRNVHFIDGTVVAGVRNANWGVRFLEFVGPRHGTVVTP